MDPVYSHNEKLTEVYHQKSTHLPFRYQSPYLVGSGPFGLNPYSGSIGFPLDGLSSVL